MQLLRGKILKMASTKASDLGQDLAGSGHSKDINSVCNRHLSCHPRWICQPVQEAHANGPIGIDLSALYNVTPWTPADKRVCPSKAVLKTVMQTWSLHESWQLDSQLMELKGICHPPRDWRRGEKARLSRPPESVRSPERRSHMGAMGKHKIYFNGSGTAQLSEHDMFGIALRSTQNASIVSGDHVSGSVRGAYFAMRSRCTELIIANPLFQCRLFYALVRPMIYYGVWIRACRYCPALWSLRHIPRTRSGRPWREGAPCRHATEHPTTPIGFSLDFRRRLWGSADRLPPALYAPKLGVCL